jgi:hypothetical protein
MAGLFWGVVAAVVVLIAECTGVRAGVYSGAAGGLVLALIGTWFSTRAMAAEPMAAEGRRNSWTWWGLGMLARLLGLVVLIITYRVFWGAEGVVVPALSMAGVYLAWLFFEVGRLYWRAETRGKEHG